MLVFSKHPARIPLGFLMAVAALAATLHAGSSQAQPAERPPNIVFIMADDLGYGDLGSYGQEKIQTPNLDRMAREGLRFAQFYSGSTVCAPSRSVLMTGQHTGRTPVRGNKRTSASIGNFPLPAQAETLAEVLQKAGYATGMFGKWGLGGPGSEGLPAEQGFDEFFGYLDQLRAHFYYPEFLFRNGERVPLKGNKVVSDPRVPGAGHPVERGTYSHDAIVDEALDFVARHQEEPFFLYLPFTIPHASIIAPEEAMAPYLDEKGKSIFPERPFPGNGYSPQPMPRAAYAGMVSRMDRDVGRLLDRLETLGIAENTIVFFTSDNGPSSEGGADPAFFDSNGPLRGKKRDLYEGGIRVPMIVWGPGQKVPSGKVSDQVWAAWDVLPTLADLAGAAVSSSVDGLSFAPAIQGQPEQQEEHAYLYWEFYEGETAQAVRKGRWKAVRQPIFTGEIELYDLSKDVGEEHDVAGQHPEVVRQVEVMMKEAHTPSGIWTASSQD